MSSSKLGHILFAPESVALIGASGDARKNTSRPQRYLRKYGYPGKIIPVNPGRDEIFGEKSYPNLQAVPDAVEQAFIMVPTDSVADAVAQCVAKKVPVATIFTDGFAESGPEGRRKQDEVLAIARAGGVRLLGPNCIGLFSSKPSYALSVNTVLEKLEIKSGPLAIISQSGSMTGGLLSRGLGRGDCEALAQAVAAMSQLAALEERTVAEAEINPLIVKSQGQGVVAVDGLIVFREK